MRFSFSDFAAVLSIFALTIAVGCQPDSPPAKPGAGKSASSGGTSSDADSQSKPTATTGTGPGAGTTGARSSPDVKPRPLPLLRRVGEFELKTADGADFGWYHLQGRAWIAGFPQGPKSADEAVWNRFQDYLGRLARRMKELGGESNVRIVLFFDNLEAAKQAVDAIGADSFKGPNAIWKVLVGEPEQIRDLEIAAYGRDLDGNPGATARGPQHPRLALVDPQGDVRGVYLSDSDESLEGLLTDTGRTLQERLLWFKDMLSPGWLEQKRQEQEATRGDVPVRTDFRFSDRKLESGIRFRHRAVDDAGRSLVTAHYDHGSGMAVADVDGDGRLDIYFVSQVGPCGLWRNLGDGKFEDITNAAGVGVPDPIKVSASFADLDNDGDVDLYVTTVLGPNILLENDGKGRFTDVSAKSGLAYSGHSSTAVFFDYDRDGRLDLLLVNVGVYTTDKKATVTDDRIAEADGREYSYFRANPDAFAAHLKPGRSERSRLYHNLGDLKFADVSDATGFDDSSWSGDAAIHDANHDGWPDIYMLNMQGHDEFYENQGGMKFAKRSRALFPSTPWGSMGISVLDFDNDGLQDIYVCDMHTDMSVEFSPFEEKKKVPKGSIDSAMLATDGNHVMGNALFHQAAPGIFEEVSEAQNVETYWPWGPSAGDLNADGFEDLFVAGGMNFPFRYSVNSVLLNGEGKRFYDSEFLVGVEPRRGGRTATPWFELDAAGRDRRHPIVERRRMAGGDFNRLVVWAALGSRSSAIFDLDDDGDLDIVTNEFHSPPMVLVNDLAQRNSDVKFLKVALEGVESNRDGLGAEVRVVAGDRTYTKVRDGKSGYMSQSSTPLYFGLGKHERVDRIEVVWPSGRKQTVDGPLETNRRLVIKESKD